MNLRSLFLLFLFLIALACTHHAKVSTNKTDREIWALKGKVKNLNEINYAENGKYVTTLLFNADGNVIHQSSFNSDGSLIRRWEYEYVKGLKKLRRCYVKNDSLSYTLFYNYDENKNITSTWTLNRDSSANVGTVAVFNAGNLLVKETSYGMDGTVEATISNTYNAGNEIDSTEKHDYVLKKSILQSFKYNHDGLKSEESFYRTDDKKLVQRITYQYGALNKPISITTYGADDQIIEKRDYHYDPAGNITETLFTDDKQVKKKQTTSYTYDKHNNWTRSIVKNDGAVNMIIERKYDYYK